MPATARRMSPLAKAIHLALVTPAIPRGVVELPTWYGEKLWRELAKGRGPLKYLKKVLRPNGKYRYFYHPAEGGGVQSHHHFVTGAAFRLGDGYYHVVDTLPDGRLVVRSSAGRRRTIEPAKLRDMLAEEHKAALAPHLRRLEEHHAARETATPTGPVTLAEARKLADSLGGGTYDPGLNLIVPKDPKKVRKAWADARDAIATRIGELPRGDAPGGPAAWQNHGVDTALHLHARAEEVRASWIEAVRRVALAGGDGAMPSMGEGNKNAVKDFDSLVEKVRKRMRLKPWPTEAEVVARFPDAIRGSVIVSHPEAIKPVIQAAIAEFGGRHVRVDNKFIGPGKRPYIAVHVDALHSEPPIRAELQVHIRDIHDGTERSPQKQDHETYKVRRGSDSARKAASRLLYLAAMRRVLATP